MDNQEEAERRAWDLFYCSHQGNGLGVPPTLQPVSTTDVALMICRAGGWPTQALGAALGKTLSGDVSGQIPKSTSCFESPTGGLQGEVQSWGLSAAPGQSSYDRSIF